MYARSSNTGAQLTTGLVRQQLWNSEQHSFVVLNVLGDFSMCVFTLRSWLHKQVKKS